MTGMYTCMGYTPTVQCESISYYGWLIFVKTCLLEWVTLHNINMIKAYLLGVMWFIRWNQWPLLTLYFS